jgi:hypothetical protein
MLSVVLYGRNDSHGYNLHKRAAISLNAIAELLTDPDDEILFVDYNTPDDLPTFPEAIADTLTDKAVARLRVLRVRAEVHRQRFAARTHLAALEPIARNVAIRRSNPANKWVLSTNTDMIFCPRAAGGTLTSVVGALEDGFYHLPRFELPEGLWETLDRKNAPALVASAREWGARFHLNEITHADRDNVYDAPGDFQLFLRQDLFDIDGFHEEMILGWHLDANMAKRMRLLRGKVSSALDHLIGYHCDHTRQSSPYHKGDRTENDQVRFDDMVTEPHVPEQRSTWGLGDVEVEEFGLRQASSARYFRALEATIPETLNGFLETQYVLEDFGRLQYTADHVLPYLLDGIASLPADIRIGYVGGRPDTWDKLRRGWGAMGGRTLLLPRDADWLGGDPPEVESLALEDWIERSDMFIFDVSAEHSTHHLDLTAIDSARLWLVDHAFKEIIDRDLERQAGGAFGRRLMIVNGVHNFFEPQVAPNVAVTLTPYSSRIRHGYISNRTAARIAGASPARKAVMRSLQSLEPPSQAEIARMGDLLTNLASADEQDGVWREAGAVAVELEVFVAAGLIDAGPASTEIAARVRQTRRSSQGKLTHLTVDPSAGESAPSRLIRVEDWDDPSWARIARRLFSNRDHAALFERDSWTWERVTLAQNLMAAAPAADRPTVLVVGKEPEILAFALAHQGYNVDIADPRALAAGKYQSVDWRQEFVRHGWVAPRPVGLIEDRAEQIADGFRYAAVLLLQNGLFITARAGAANVLQAASALVEPGGHLGVTALAQPLMEDERLQEHALPYALTANGAFGAALANLTDLEPDGAVDNRLTARSLDRSAPSAERLTQIPPPLMLGEFPELDVPGVWALKKSVRPTDWATLKDVLQTGSYGAGATTKGGSDGPAGPGLIFAEDLLQAPVVEGMALFGARFDAVTPTPPLIKSPRAVHVPASFGARVAAIAPLGRIPVGSYELDIEILASPLAPSGVLLAVGVVSDGRLVAEFSMESSLTGGERLQVLLEVAGEGWRSASIVLKAQGLADFDILNLALR